MGRTARHRLRKRRRNQQQDIIPLNSSPIIISLVRKLRSLSKQFLVSSVSVAAFPTPLSTFKYRGIQATQNVLPGCTLLQIPEKLLITPSVATTRLRYRLENSEFLNNSSLATLFTIFLVQEIKEFERSSFLEYIQTLPENFNQHPLYMTDRCVQLLPKFYSKSLDAQNECMSSSFRAMCSLNNRKSTSFEIFKFAWLAVHTRTVFYASEEGAKDMALAPYLDLFNHSPEPNTRTFYDKNTRSYVISSIQRIKRFDQVFISYGNHSNHTLWLDYGFTPIQHNPFNQIQLEFGILINQDAKWLRQIIQDKRKWKLVKKFGLSEHLCLLSSELSPNLSLLVQLSIWDPELTKTFDFQIHYEDPQFKKIASEIVCSELVQYEASIVALNDFAQNVAVYAAIIFLRSSVEFMRNLLQSLM